MIEMVTSTGRLFDLESAQPRDISLEDIAHHLALISRFSGATVFPYSVAQHSCLAVEIASEHTSDPLSLLHVLLHDAHEAYLNDIIHPFKKRLNQETNLIQDLSSKLDQVIWKSLGIPTPSQEINDLIARVDESAFQMELFFLTKYPYRYEDIPIGFFDLPYKIEETPWQDVENSFYSMVKAYLEMLALKTSC